MIFYRYNWQEYATHDIDGELISPQLPNPKIELQIFYLDKETPKGYWILLSPNSKSWRKWISKESKKRFAYPTKKEAMINFIKRTEKRMEILKHQLSCCQIAIDNAKYINKNISQWELDKIF